MEPEEKKQQLAYLKDMYELRRTHRGLPGGFHNAEEESRAREQIVRLEQEIADMAAAGRLLSGYSIPHEPFSGREKETAKIRESLGRDHIVLINGIGGIGKSALAWAYAQRVQDDYEQVLYLPVSRSLLMTVTDDAGLRVRPLAYSARKYRSRTAYARAKTEFLAACAGEHRILVIVDDVSARDRKILKEMLSVPADFILTSRERAGELGLEQLPASCEITLAELAAEEVPGFVSLFCPSVSGTDLERFARFTESSGRHPLAMKLFLTADRPDESVIFHGISDLILKKGMLKKEEKQMLVNMAVMPEAGVGRSYFCRITGIPEPAAERMISRSLVIRTDEDVLIMHSLVKQAVLHAMKPNYANSKKMLNALAADVANAWNEEKQVSLPKEPVVLAVCDAFPHPFPWMYRAFSAFVTFLWVRERYEEAAALAGRLFASVVKKYGEPHQVTGETALRTAAVYHNAMQFDAARGWYFRALENLQACTPVNEEYERRLVSAISRVARIYANEQDHEHAVFYLEQGLEHTGRMKQKGEIYAYVQSSYLHRRYAEIRLKEGKIEEAEAHRALMHSEMEHYFRTEGAAEVRQNDMRETDIAFAVYKKEYRTALSLLYQNLPVFIRYRGNTHEDTLHCRQMIAECQSRLGDKKGALAVSASVLRILEEEYPFETEWQEQLRSFVRSLG